MKAFILFGLLLSVQCFASDVLVDARARKIDNDVQAKAQLEISGSLAKGLYQTLINANELDAGTFTVRFSPSIVCTSSNFTND